MLVRPSNHPKHTMNTNTDTIHALRDAAREIRSLRQQITAVKAEAYDVHSEVIKRLFAGSQLCGVCPAYQAERVAEELAKAEVDPANGSNAKAQAPKPAPENDEN